MLHLWILCSLFTVYAGVALAKLPGNDHAGSRLLRGSVKKGDIRRHRRVRERLHCDRDGDGYVSPGALDCSHLLNAVDAPRDCNDDDPAVHPNADEICGDGIDNNCNGEIDEDGCIFARVEAEDYIGAMGSYYQPTVSLMGGQGNYRAYGPLTFGSAGTTNAIRILYSKAYAGGLVEFRLDDPLEPIVGSFYPKTTDDWNTWQSATVPIVAEGVHDLYIVGVGGVRLEIILELVWFELANATLSSELSDISSAPTLQPFEGEASGNAASIVLLSVEPSETPSAPPWNVPSAPSNQMSLQGPSDMTSDVPSSGPSKSSVSPSEESAVPTRSSNPSTEPSSQPMTSLIPSDAPRAKELIRIIPSSEPSAAPSTHTMESPKPLNPQSPWMSTTHGIGWRIRSGVNWETALFTSAGWASNSTRLFDSEDHWQIVDTGYDTDDMVLAAVVMTADRLPTRPDKKDCSKAFRKAFKEASSLGGGFVYAPPGQYLFKKSIEIPPNVVLRGAWGSVAGSDKSVRGTVLKVTYGGKETKGDPAFIQLNLRAGLRDLSIWYPNQSLVDVIPYSRTIGGAAGSNPEELNIQNVNLVNSYVGISIEDNAKRPFCRGLFGSPLKTGIFQAYSSSVPFYSGIHFSADYWSESRLPGSPSKSKLKKYLSKKATGVKIGSSDNIFASEWHVSDYKTGFLFVPQDGKMNINGNMYGLVAKRCRTGLLAESIGPSFIINSSFEGSKVGASINIDNPLGVTFEGCKFKSEFECTLDGRQTRNLRFQKCSFDASLVAGSTDLSIVDSEFKDSSEPPIKLTAKTGFATLAGNTFAYDGDPVELNGASRKDVLVDSRPTFSKTYTHFDTNGHRKTYKPTAQNLIVMGSDNYDVAVDGTTNDAPAIQKALDEVFSKGGGIVLLPQISPEGYAIRSSLNVPAGVELRSSSEGLHSFNGAREDIPGALLQIYHGREDDKATITLGKGSGCKGFTIHYPEQFMDDIVPYAVTVKATGDGAYVTNTQFINSYDHIEFNGSDEFLAETIMGQHIHRPFKVVDCKNGRFNRNFVRDEWDDSNFATATDSTAQYEYAMRNCIAYEVESSSNVQILACFSRQSDWLATFRNSTFHSLQFSMESCQNGVQVDGIPQGGSVELIGSSLRTNNDIPGETLTMFDAKRGSDGDLLVFSALCDGHADTVLKATNVNVLLQNSIVTLDPKVPTNGLQLGGTSSGVVRVENCIFRKAYISTKIPVAAGKRLELVSSYFDSGLDYFSYPGEVQNTVDASDIDADTRLAEVANVVRRAVSSQMNLDKSGGSGLILLKAGDFVRDTKAFAYRQWHQTLSGYVPTGNPEELLFNVKSGPFEEGDEPKKASVKMLYYDWKPGSFVVEYKLPSGGSWQTARKFDLNGDDGFIISPGEKGSNPHFYEEEISVPGDLFRVGSKTRLTVKKGKAMFMYVSLEATSGRMAQSPL